VDERHTGIRIHPGRGCEAADKVFIERVAQKVAAHYVPPIGATSELTQDQAVEITMDKETADKDYIQPIVRIPFDIDCPGRLDRILNVFFLKGTNAQTRSASGHTLARKRTPMCFSRYCVRDLSCPCSV
jgi:hypothetical protein